MENAEAKLSSVLPLVHENDEGHTSWVSSSGSDTENKERMNAELQDPISDTNDDEEEAEEEDAAAEGEEGEDEEEESDCESCISSGSPKGFEFFSVNGLVECAKGDIDYNIITERFLSDLGDVGKDTTVVAIQKNLFDSPSGQAWVESFQIFSQATFRKRQGHANIKCAWYGNSKDGISKIISHGFGKCEKPNNSELFGLGIYLTPQQSSVERIMSSPMDENGLRHVLLCRVILGNVEQVRPGSEQFHPSSEEFDSGVDNLFFPKKYIVWSTNMNTHILPDYVISFRTPISLEGFRRPPMSAREPNSVRMSFGTLIMELSRCLHPEKISFLKKYLAAFRERKITRAQMIQIVRLIAGDNLIASVIKSFKAKLASEASSSGS